MELWGKEEKEKGEGEPGMKRLDVSGCR